MSDEPDIPSRFLASGDFRSVVAGLAGDLIGTRIGVYDVTSLLGVGGMGQVYRARDTKLARDVALKVLPPAYTADRERLARFVREARVLASLNHPGIAAIHDLDESSGTPVLVLELVEGDTLADRLHKGPLPLTEALKYASQLADALEAAHEKGIVHRDLKPSNIKMTADGTLKVLDFGLAKVADSAEADFSQSDGFGTRDGAIVGTVGYMSPEQARGRTVDKRTDIWAYGCVLYEMLTGAPPFAGDTMSDTVVSILERQPDWTLLPGTTPPAVRRVLQRCLEKDPKFRLRDIGDARLEMTEAIAFPSGDPSSSIEQAGQRHPRRWVAAGVLLGVGAASVLAWVYVGSPNAAVPVRTDAVVVLPFESIGDSAPHLAEGMTESVTRAIGKIERTRVIASNSASAYGGRGESATDIGRALNAGLLVRGSLQREGARVRINAALVDTVQDVTLWSERFDRAADDILAVQDDIAWHVAHRLASAVGRAAPVRSSPVSSTTPEAYDAYLRARSHMRGPSGIATAGKRLAAAIQEFERSVSLDGKFALARAGLATAYTQRFFYDETDSTYQHKAFVEIEKALATNPDLAEAYLARAQLAWNLRNGFPHEQAIADLRRALANNPNLVEAYVELSKIYFHIGLLDKSIAASEEALKLDPLATAAAVRRFHSFIDGRMLDRIRDVLALDPRWLTRSEQVDALLALGDTEAALKALDHRSPMGDTGRVPDLDTNNWPFRAQIFARLKRRGDAERVLQAVIPPALNPTGLSHLHHAQFVIGCTFALLGRADEAVEWLTKAANEGYPSYPRFSTEPDLESVRTHRKFVELLDRLRRDFQRWNATL